MTTGTKENRSYTDLDVWKESRLLVKMIYAGTNSFPENEKFGLTLQIRRAAISVISNIAEGIGRNYKKDTLQFLYISKGSLYELETQLIVSNDLSFLSEKDLSALLDKIIFVKKLLNGLINYYRKSIEQ